MSLDDECYDIRAIIHIPIGLGFQIRLEKMKESPTLIKVCETSLAMGLSHYKRSSC